MPQPQQPAPLVAVPLERLSAELLTAVIEQFVLREGTDYGLREASFETKVAQVRSQLERRQAFVVFDGATETITIVKAEECPRENLPET